MNQEQNVDASEVEKFNALAHRWWDPDSDFKPLHQINPLRANYIDTHTPVAGKKVLDVGCGGGILSEALAHRGAEVTGIDMSSEPLNVAKIHRLESGLDIDYQQSTAEAWAEQHQGEYDIVACLEMLEHVPDPGAVIAACSTLLKPGGQVYFSTINRNPKSYLFAIIGAEYILQLLPKGIHDYAKFIKPSEMAAWARAANLQVQDIKGMSYNPLTTNYKINQDTRVNYLMSCQKVF